MRTNPSVGPALRVAGVVMGGHLRIIPMPHGLARRSQCRHNQPSPKPERNVNLLSRAALFTSLLAATAIASGCAGPMSVHVMELRGQQRRVTTDMVDVAISEADRERIDESFGPFDFPPLKVRTGPVWAMLFVGEAGRSPLFTISSAELQSEIAAAGFAARIRYVVEGNLSFNGRDCTIHAEGVQTTGGFGHPESDAVQSGVIDAARKAKFILSGGMSAEVPVSVRSEK